MLFKFRRSYRGPVQAVILDWAGTTVDHGSRAPAAVFVKVFQDQGVTITLAQARGPMGLMKRDHIRAIASLPTVAAQWQQAHHGQPWTEADIEALYQAFIPLQIAILEAFAEPIAGVPALAARLRQRGLKLGATTGYVRPMMEKLAPLAEARGYAPDTWVCPSDTLPGRPYPWMLHENARQLGVYPPEAIVKYGDTVPDIEEGLNAGAWTVAVARTGNELGLSADEVAALPAAELAERLGQARQRLAAAGAHYVVDGPEELEGVLDDIDRRLVDGEKP